MKVLALIPDFPYPPNGGAKVRNYYLWNELKDAGVEVRILGLCSREITDENLKRFPGKFFGYDRKRFLQRALNTMFFSYHQFPFSTTLRIQIEKEIAQWQPDIVHAEELRMAAYLPVEIGKRFKTTLTVHNVESDLQKVTGSAPYAFASNLINFLHFINLKNYEKRSFSSVNQVFAYSDNDMIRYKSLFPNYNFLVTSNGASIKNIAPAPMPQNKKLLIVGSLSYQPNIKGLIWFIENVLPRLPENLPVTVAGSNASSDLKDFLRNSSRINFFDSPDKLDSLYHTHSICLAPVFEGSGTRGKILEALAFERPIITTKIGASGLGLSESDGVLVAETAEEMITLILELESSHERCTKLGQQGRKAVAQKFDWKNVALKLLENWKK